MNLSERAKSFMQRVRREQRPEQKTAEEIVILLEARSLPRIESFVDCLETTSGLTFDAPFNFHYFFPLAKVLGPEAEKDPYIFNKDGVWWFDCSELAYPSAGMMHESGSLHFDCDLDEPYASCLGKVIEQSALLDSLNFVDKVIQAVAVVKGTSILSVVDMVGGELDPHATDMCSAYCLRNDGIVVLLRTHAKNDGRYGIRALMTNEEEVEDLRSRIGESAISFSILEPKYKHA